jgi:hypothetical protein
MVIAPELAAKQASFYQFYFTLKPPSKPAPITPAEAKK